MKRILAAKTIGRIGEEVLVSGWVHARRDHGKIIFLDLRDRSGLLQIVIGPDSTTYEVANRLRPEWVILVEGFVRKRPENMINTDIVSGTVELVASKIEVLNEAKTSPFEIDKDTSHVDEDLRLEYRYLDLRSDRMNRNIILRHEIVKFIREYLYEKEFREIETPYLTKSTPEGAREYIVPSRLYPGQFYVLPQSPQQFKQLLMIAGIERYFQIARCFRDEDQRGDRQPEFTQLDLEMSFVEQEDILSLTEDLMIKIIKKTTPEKKITAKPFPHIKYIEAMKKYKTDKPDLRKNKKNKNELAFAWIVDAPLFKYSPLEKKLVSSHHPFTMPRKEDLDKLDTKPEEVRAYSYDLVLNGFEIAGGSIRIHKSEIQDKIFTLLGLSPEEKRRRFGHLLRAFEYGAPPHGGIAAGIDRIVAILCGEEVIREAIAFPKSGDARDPLMGAPAVVSRQQLKDVHIQLTSEGKGKAIKNPDTRMNE